MTLLDGVRNLIWSGIQMRDFSKMASFNPDVSLKIDNMTGSIKVGKYADLVVLNKNLNVVYTFVDGK